MLAQVAAKHGPVRKQQDFFKLIAMSSQFSSRLQRWSSFSRSTTDWDIRRISSAYKMINIARIKV